MPEFHAKLSPSSSERWISCPASVRVAAELKVEGVEEAESIWSAEGTAAHALGEMKARFLILESMTLSEFNEAYAAWLDTYDWVLSDANVDLDDMHEHTNAYVELIKERLALYPNSVLMLEQRLDTGVPTSWGTSDTVIVSPRHVEIIDFKYGAGVYVMVVENSQLRLYAVGALDTYADMLGDTEVVRITVHQPRMGNIATEEISPAELREWRDGIIPIAEQALGPDAPFGPSDEACRWCPASGRCRAQLEEVFKTDFDTDPGLLRPEDLAAELPRIDYIKQWLASFEVAALDMAYSEGQDIPGYKVVMSGGIRKVIDPDGARDTLVAAGYDLEQIGEEGDFKVYGVGKLEKLLKKEKFKELLEDTGYVRKSEGRPSLVPEEDARPSVNRNSEAQRDFAEQDES